MSKVNIIKFGEYYAVRVRSFWIFDSYVDLGQHKKSWLFKGEGFFDYCLTKDISEAQKAFDYRIGFEKGGVVK